MGALSQTTQIKDRETQRVVRDIYEVLQPLVGQTGPNDKRAITQRDLLDLKLAVRDPRGNLRNPLAQIGTSEDSFLEWLSEGFLAQVFSQAAFTVGAEAGNVITVNIQLEDGLGNEITGLRSCFGYFSDNSDGSTITTAPPDTSLAAGTDGELLDISGSRTTFQLVSEIDGDIDVVIGESGAKTIYLVLITSSNSLAISGPITFV